MSIQHGLGYDSSRCALERPIVGRHAAGVGCSAWFSYARHSTIQHSHPLLKRCIYVKQWPRGSGDGIGAWKRKNQNLSKPTSATYSMEVITSERDSMDGEMERTLDRMWDGLAERFGPMTALVDPHAPGKKEGESYTFWELRDCIDHFAKGLIRVGRLECGERVSLFSENSARWMIADQAIMRCGAVDAVRGISSSGAELKYILKSSQSVGLVVQDMDALDKVMQELEDETVDRLRCVVVLWDNGSNLSGRNDDNYKANKENTNPDDDTGQERYDMRLQGKVHSFEHIVELGRKEQASLQDFAAQHTRDDVATLVYTSGTTGEPKGVKLTHGNILYQMDNFHRFTDVEHGDKTLSILPPWHIYERTAAYFILSKGARIVYTNIRKMKNDLVNYPPDHFVCVPLVLDTLHNRILATLKNASFVRKNLAICLLKVSLLYTRARRVVKDLDITYALEKPSIYARVVSFLTMVMLWPFFFLSQAIVGKKIRNALGIKKSIISGGGSLGPHLDDFYEAIGIDVLNGWGLTECSPVLACRSKLMKNGNVRGTVGRVIHGTELRIVDPDTFEVVPDGDKGLILARGPGVFVGYDSNEEATKAAFLNGWFITGDIGWRVPNTAGKMAGCIVLQGRSKDTIVLLNGENVEPLPIEDDICRSPFVKFAILVGNGHRSLGALIVPDKDALTEEENKLGAVLSQAEVKKLIWDAVHEACSGRPVWERIAAIQVLNEPFSFENGTLTRTMKPRRPVIMEAYAKDVSELESHLR